MLYLIVGVQLQQYPENFAFEVSSRMLSLFGIKPFITKFIKQIDEQSVHYCSLIVPYRQLQPPRSGLIYSMNRHTTSIVDFDFTEDQTKAITLSDRIIIIDMGEVRTVLDINLPSLDEPYLNSTTLPDTYTFDGKNEIKDARSSNDRNDEFKRHLFLVNSLHHFYLVLVNENIKFEHSSKVDYLTVEMLDNKRLLCVVAERNTNYVEYWNVVRNRLFDRLDFPKAKVKYVLCAQVYSMIIVVLQDGIIQFYSITDWTKSPFVHRSSIHAEIHLQLVAITGGVLIHTLNANIPIDFALIGLKQFHKTEQILSDKQVLKTLVAFDPPMGPKPIKNIILPDTDELTSWSYQCAASIHCTRLFFDDVTINECVIASNNLNSEIIYVLILTSNHWIVIYSAKSLNDEALYSLHLPSPARVHSTISENFYVLTCNGIVYSIAQQITSDNEFNFNQKVNSQLKIPCSMMLSSVVALNGLESLIVFADNGQSMAICTMERVIYIDVDVSPYTSSSSLKSITSEKTQNLLLLYFNNKTLISCQVKLDESNERGSLQLTPFDQADKFCLQNNCLATYNNGNIQLNLHNIRSCTCYEPIELDNECQYLCFNESATYVFALVKPRVLFMYRMADRRQMAKLFVYDFVLSMVADNDFLVLAMNDRRLLILMITDPDDPTLQARIQALPSRYVT
ncbi:unnamed protein product [Rotaria sp. Silwood2]|nr:unnamed protein product [Rotaria sp. Silwood2]CAF4156389.1 unnamed protein product [Rotaria sp. Silwood2]